MKRQKLVDKEKEEDEYEKEENTERIEIKENQRKKRHKKKKKELIISPQNINDEEAFKNQFKEKTDFFSRKYLNTVKTDIGLSLVEHQLKKNEALNDITEEILDLKGELMNKLIKLEMKQKAEMKTLAYCLQNSGDDKIENLANRLFGEDILKPEEENLNFNSDGNSLNTTVLKFTGSQFNNTNLFKTNVRRKSIDQRRKSSVDTNINIEEKTTRVKFRDDDPKTTGRRSSLFGKEKTMKVIEEKEDENEQ